MDGSSLEPLLIYLRTHSDRYGLEALREQLVQSGYDPAVVDEAVAVYQSAAVRPRVWPRALMVLAVNAVLMAVAVRVLISGPPGDDRAKLIGFLLLMIGGGELLGGIVLAQRQKSRAWGFGLVLGIPLSIGLGILVLFGLCGYFYNKGMWG